jgi:hypothetical protein
LKRRLRQWPWILIVAAVRAVAGAFRVCVSWQRAVDRQTAAWLREQDQRDAARLRCVEAMRRTARDVIERRLSLLEAAATLRGISASCPDFDEAEFRKNFSGASDEGRVCRQVVWIVQTELCNDPRLDKTKELLEKELISHLARGPGLFRNGS